jgi:glutaconate CoA-transferase subunit B
VLITLQQSTRTFVPKVDFVTSVGYLDGGAARQRLDLPGQGPVAVITDLCILEPEPISKELEVTHLHPGITREQVAAATGWPLRFRDTVRESMPPTGKELGVLRDLQRRTAAAHG